MKTMIGRTVGTFLFFIILAGTSVPARAVDPRTLNFPPLSFSIPKSERVVLQNGMTVYLLEDHELPLVAMNAYVRTGGIYEPSDKVGLAGITGAVMRSGGTVRTPAEKLDADLEFMASTVESSIGTEMGNVSLTCLKKNLDQTLRYFAEVLREPAFREDRVKLAKNSTIESLRRQNDNPKALADRELRKALYAGHPLGRIPTMATVRNVTRDDMVAFHSTYFHPNNIILAVSGDFTRDELIKKLEAAFTGWKKKATDFPKLSEPVQPPPEVLYVKKDVNQSVLRVGELGIEKNNPDLYAVRVLDYILGGGFTSRLTTEIRSNQGLAYAIDSNLDIGRRFPGLFSIQTETKSETTGKALSIIRQIVTDLREAPVSEQELQIAKDSIINSFIFGFAKPDAVVNMQVRLEYFGYQKGYLENYRDNIAKVTRDDVLRVARKYLHPEGMITLVVGDDQNFDKPLSIFGKVRLVVPENGK